MNKEENLSQRRNRLYEYLHQASLDDSILLKDEDWKRVEVEVKALWPDLGLKLHAYGVYLSDMEIRICWLVRMNISPKGIAVLLKRSKPAISLARARLYEKLHGTKGNGAMFNEFIRKL